jgi:hypothetical protein
MFLALRSPANVKENPVSALPDSFLYTTRRRNMKLTPEMPAVISTALSRCSVTTAPLRA